MKQPRDITRIPFPIYGGKINHLQVILPQIPPHKTYVEPFGGSAAVLLNKKPSPVEVYNDVDGGAVNFFRVLRDNTEELIRQVSLTPYSREEYAYCKQGWSTCPAKLEKARMWYFVAATSFNGRFGRGYSYGATQRRPLTYQNRVAALWEVAARMSDVYIENLDFREVIKRYDTPDSGYYLDPPYCLDTRNANARYEHEMSEQDYDDLVQILLRIKGKAVLSNYDSPIFVPLEQSGWKKISYQVKTVAALGGGPRGKNRTECLWIKT